MAVQISPFQQSVQRQSQAWMCASRCVRFILFWPSSTSALKVWNREAVVSLCLKLQVLMLFLTRVLGGSFLGFPDRIFGLHKSKVGSRLGHWCAKIAGRTWWRWRVGLEACLSCKYFTCFCLKQRPRCRFHMTMVVMLSLIFEIGPIPTLLQRCGSIFMWELYSCICNPRPCHDGMAVHCEWLHSLHYPVCFIVVHESIRMFMYSWIFLKWSPLIVLDLRCAKCNRCGLELLHLNCINLSVPQLDYWDCTASSEKW